MDFGIFKIIGSEYSSNVVDFDLEKGIVEDKKCISTDFGVDPKIKKSTVRCERCIFYSRSENIITNNELIAKVLPYISP